MIVLISSLTRTQEIISKRVNQISDIKINRPLTNTCKGRGGNQGKLIYLRRVVFQNKIDFLSGDNNHG